MATPPDIRKDRFRAASESSRREMAAKRKAVEETPSPGPGGASSSIASQTFLDQANILQTADELAKSNADVGRICTCEFLLISHLFHFNSRAYQI